MNRQRLVLLIVAAAVLALAGWWAMPRLLAAMPGRVRQYVPEAVLAELTTPLPAALPAPTGPTPAALATALAAPIATLAMPTLTPPPPTATRPADQSLSTTATPAPITTPSPIPTQPPPYARVGELPIIPQKFNNCGPTNLTIVLNHYGVDVDQFDVAGVVRPNYEDRNVSPGELVAYVNDHTPLRAAAYAGGDLDLLRRLLRAGLPVIIEKGLEPDAATGWMGHYLTVYGYDDITSHFLVRDTFLGPWRGDGLARYADTEHYWAQFNNTFIVVYPAERAADVAATLGPTFADPATMWAAAAERARAAARLTPDDAFAWFNLGTSLTELAALNGDNALFGTATAAYDQARLLGLPPRMVWYQFGMYAAYLAAGRAADVLALTEATLENQGGRNVEETYYYRGLALAAAGDEAGAQAALARAAELNPAVGH
ncbi:Tetratricopeptide TPR_1 repeat-containing protein [Candidatus Promineifilum breve]|uniref:Tetratricopeptide TPR_1 repeat-containing protein n=1 Tax=Candidatus Promineifilum breve TaxID=1806508 RepID=A0A170PJR8_9CHLR|nr:C39 family peptidase [Candidatus Promineifilum breve]CUS05893.1 Tetratricopeptide TPR_1 repeat-containing protein [Candidatus Promineifilum breve]